MSGIGAIFNRTGRPAGQDGILRLAQALACYGPERQATAMSGPCALAWCHMPNTPESAFDLQPVAAGEGRYLFVFDGRLDNREDLAETLGIDARALASMADSSLALATWQARGLDAPAGWAGEFSAIVWDRQERLLHLIRDPFNRRALSYFADSTALIVSSAPKGIHAASGLARAVDQSKLADALSLAFEDPERGYMRDIFRAPAGHVLSFGPDRHTRTCYWSPDSLPDVRLRNDDAYAEAGREVLARAVKPLLRTRGKAGAFMSGGLDSSSAAVTALQFLPSGQTRLPVFTWVPEAGWDRRVEAHCYGDETEYVREIVRMHPALDLNLVDAAGLNHYHRLDEFLRAAEMPPHNALNLSWIHQILDQARKQGVTAMIDGGMGNVTMSWSGQGAYLDWFRQNEWRRLARELWLRSHRRARLLPGRAWHGLVAPHAPAWLWDAWSRLRATRQNGPSWQGRCALNPGFAGGVSSSAVQGRSRPFLNGKPASDTRALRGRMLTGGLASEIGDLAQGLRALHGVETRDPFCDRRLVEWCLGIPEEQYLRNGRTRWLMTRVMASKLPDTVLAKRTTGRQCSDWHLRLGRDLDRMKQDLTALEDDTDTAGMIDINTLRSHLDNWPDHTVVDARDDRRFFLPGTLPAAMVAGRFVRLVKAAND